MSVNFSNHNLEFTYVKRGGDGYYVYGGKSYLGVIKKHPGGWMSFFEGQPNYRTGPRKHAAEHLAFLVGLLDENYNNLALPGAPKIRNDLKNSGDKHLVALQEQLTDDQLLRLKELVVG